MIKTNMMEMRKGIVVAAMLAFVAASSRGEYNLVIKRGDYPVGG